MTVPTKRSLTAGAIVAAAGGSAALAACRCSTRLPLFRGRPRLSMNPVRADQIFLSTSVTYLANPEFAQSTLKDASVFRGVRRCKHRTPAAIDREAEPKTTKSRVNKGEGK